tara:strand:+ start:3900 stop:4298 length:399 start_codon:yes stop_codon:yes gene_type:complete
MANENAKKHLHFVLQAHVTASADAGDDTHITVGDVESILNESQVTFTVTKQDPKTKKKMQVEMTERAKKVMIGSALKQYKKVLADRGSTDKQIDAKVKKLRLKDIKDSPKMTKVSGFDFDDWEKGLVDLAKG